MPTNNTTSILSATHHHILTIQKNINITLWNIKKKIITKTIALDKNVKPQKILFNKQTKNLIINSYLGQIINYTFNPNFTKYIKYYKNSNFQKNPQTLEIKTLEVENLEPPSFLSYLYNLITMNKSKPNLRIKINRPINGILFGTNNNTISIFSKDKIKIYDTETSKPLYSLRNNGNDISSIAFGSKNTFFSGDNKGNITVWNLTKQNPIFTKKIQQHSIKSIYFNEKKSTLVVLSTEG